MEKPIITALSSYGMSGQLFHAPFLVADKHFKLTRVLERSKNLSAEKIPDAHIVRDYSDLVSDPSIELIVVNTPNQLHYPMTKLALEKGKHVIVEKPFTPTVPEAEELISIAKSKGLVLAVYQNRRFDCDFQTVKKMVGENLLGKIKLFESQIYRWKPELGAKLWKTDPGLASGLLYDLGSHLIDQALVLFGKPKSIFADLGVFRENAKVDDYFELIFNYSSKKAVLKSFLMAAYEPPRFTIYGNKGSYVKIGPDVQENLLLQGVIPGTERWDTAIPSQGGTIYTADGIVNLEPVQSGYQLFYDNVYHAIRKGMELLIKPEEACEVIRLIELAMQSFREKKVIKVA